MPNARNALADSITLVACCGPKLGSPARAADLYVSQLFKKVRTYVERRGRWFILSARHGLVDPNTVIARFELSPGLSDRVGQKPPEFARNKASCERSPLSSSSPPHCSPPI